MQWSSYVLQPVAISVVFPDIGVATFASDCLVVSIKGTFVALWLFMSLKRLERNFLEHPVSLRYL